MRFDPSRTFESLLVTPSNRDALRTVRRFLAERETSPTVLLIRGPVGSGKTHLVHAIANELEGRTPRRWVRYFTGEMFMNAFVHDIREGRMQTFREDNTRSRSILVIDGLEELNDFPTAEEEIHRQIAFLLANEGSAIVVAGPTTRAQERRIKRGMASYGRRAVVRWRAPDLPTRMHALQQHLRDRGRYVSRTQLASIARRARTIPEARAALDSTLFRMRA